MLSFRGNHRLHSRGNSGYCGWCFRTFFYAVVEVTGVPVKGLVDPGSSVTIMSFELFKEVGAKAAIPREALKKPDVTL